MPLKKGKSNVSENIKELMKSYKKTGKHGTSKPKSKKAAHKQAVAIALNKAGKLKFNKESYDNLVNEYLKTYLLEMQYIEFGGDRENATPEDREFNEWLKQKFKDRPGFLRNLPYDQDMVTDLLHDFRQERAQSGKEDDDEECKSTKDGCGCAKDGCKCDNCPECQANQEQGDQMLSFYFPAK
jgi:hypothetical protein